MKRENSRPSVLKRFVDLFCFIGLAVSFLGLQFLGVFDSIDFRLYDGMLAMRPEPAQSERIVLIDADNKSIQELGEWPWSRDIIGDTLLRLKEFGADTAVFDIEYLSPSAKGVPSGVENKIDSALEETYYMIDESIKQLSNAISNNYYKMKEIPSVIDESVAAALDESMSDLQKLLSHNIYRDNDEYLAKCLEFFANAWLTVNICDISIQYNPEDIDYVKNRFLYDNVKDENGLIKQTNDRIFHKMYGSDSQAFCPALPKIIRGANGAGFTNVTVDSDGTRRRMELLYDVDGKYLGQLVFAPLLKYLDVREVVREPDAIVLYDAKYPDSEKKFTIRIPLDENGTMIINWLHKPYIESFRHISFSDIKRLDMLENVIVNNLEALNQEKILDREGNYLPYVSEIEDILSAYQLILEEKDRLLDKCNGISENGENVTGISQEEYESYFGLRKNFYQKFFDFMEKIEDTSDSMLSRLKELVLYTEEEKALAREEAEKAKALKSDVEQADGVEEVENSEEEEAAEEVPDMVSPYISSGDYNLYAEFHAEAVLELNANYSELKETIELFTEILSGNFCILGNTASSTTDMGATPFISRYENVGCHANVVNTILQRDFISTAAWYWLYVAAVIIYLILILIFRKKSIKVQNIVYAVAAFLIIIVPFIFMVGFALYMPSICVMAFIFVNYFTGLGIRFRLSSNEKKFIRQAFSTYVSKDVVNEIIKDPNKALKLGGEEKDITALFTDVRKFSTFSELVSPEKLVSILNDYLGALSDVILAEKGTIDKYIGDSIVSFFGAPMPLDDHAYRACCSAVKMKKAEDEFNQRFLMENEISDPRFTKYFSDGLYSRIGINTGRMVAGNMGTTGKMNYTAMGNDMNLASRLEGVNKKYGSKILISDKTWNEVNYGEHKDEFVVRRADKVRVVGISTPVQLYNLIGFRSEISNKKLEQIDVFHEALDLYLKKDFNGAMKGFMRAQELDPSDETASIFAKTCSDYIVNGIPEGWDGIINLTSK